jgi:hypothetical protein
MNTVLDVKQRIKALVGDPDGDFCTDAYLLPLINLAYEDSINALEGTCSPFITQLQPCPNLPLGTTSLVAQQKAGQPLDGLVNPLSIEIKQAGQPDTSYCFLKRVDILPNSSNIGLNQPANIYWQSLCWEWRSYVIYLTTLPYPADIRVRGEFRPPALVKDTDPIVVHPMMAAALAYAAAALVGAERGNAGYVTKYGDAATARFDDISAELVRQQQGTTSRVGRMSNGRGRGGTCR